MFSRCCFYYTNRERKYYTKTRLNKVSLFYFIIIKALSRMIFTINNNINLYIIKRLKKANKNIAIRK